MTRKSKGTSQIDNPQPKGGRPPGTANGQYETTEKILPRCIACGCTAVSPIAGRKAVVFDHCGMHEGQPYTSIRRQHSRCTHCGQVQIVTTYTFDPAKWTEGKNPQR
ncbi:MAG: hypothetical protein BWX88_05013 [Planctomycetes bacterium ADurb.Bin126]|nr:MAG: hypothetical protein BWX88_05013 [Planctomycetes bacterium ADurb.Bin126]